MFPYMKVPYVTDALGDVAKKRKFGSLYFSFKTDLIPRERSHLLNE